MTGAAARRYRFSIRRYLAELWLPAPDPAIWLPTPEPTQERHLTVVREGPPVATAPPATTQQAPTPTPKPRHRGPTDRQRKCSPHRRARTLPTTGRVLVIPFVKAWEAAQRPKTRGDCLPGGINAARPCPWVSCRHNLAVEINEEIGSLKVIFPTSDSEIDWQTMPQSCSLDVADTICANSDGKELELEEIGKLMNRSRERIFQISNKGLQELRAAERRRGE